MLAALAAQSLASLNGFGLVVVGASLFTPALFVKLPSFWFSRCCAASVTAWQLLVLYIDSVPPIWVTALNVRL